MIDIHGAAAVFIASEGMNGNSPIDFAHGASFGEILEGYPDLDREDILRAFEYAEWLKRWAN